MRFSDAVTQQWQKSELAEQMRLRLSSEPMIQELLVGATSLATVCNLAVALAFAEQAWDKDDWDDNLLVAVLFCAFRLLFFKATQQPLTQAEDLIISISSRLAASIQAEQLHASAVHQVQLMQQLADQLKTLRRQQRSEQLNMR
ncbi:hypothetical protein L9G15_16775 [Shewanella sp. A3A]|uniref:Uncharacterized protein n=1 Tax=Shewanella electrica TaxID=515560 RepID=A0ABT2FK99_9GAMM|nr:hypothetical protein [Shewanella electrica]MCH1921080.1 hypothetical protein [Shewanella ferrihydritica]MCH1924192.1 hypothetical protein [Shewanella electrica]MCS4556095.1 hypothetical protein [Shewanella electrica]